MNKNKIEYIAFEGKRLTIEWYYTESLKSSGLEYYLSLEDSKRKALITLFLLMDREGKILNPTKFNYEGDKVYAFKQT